MCGVPAFFSPRFCERGSAAPVGGSARSRTSHGKALYGLGLFDMVNKSDRGEKRTRPGRRVSARNSTLAPLRTKGLNDGYLPRFHTAASLKPRSGVRRFILTSASSAVSHRGLIEALNKFSSSIYLINLPRFHTAASLKPNHSEVVRPAE
jgi:hypothetical protein